MTSEKFQKAVAKLMVYSSLKPFAFVFMKYPTKYMTLRRTPAMVISNLNTKKTILAFDLKMMDELFDVEEMLFVLLHEILHIIHFHNFRNHPDIPEIINQLSHDHVINVPLKKEANNGGPFSVPTKYQPFTVPELEEDESTHNWTAERVAKYIMDNYDYKEETTMIPLDGTPSGGDSNKSQGSKGHGNQQEADETPDESGNENQGQSSEEPSSSESDQGQDGGSGRSIPVKSVELTHKKTGKTLYATIDVGIDPNMIEELQDESEMLKPALNEILNQLKQRGLGKGHLLEHLEQITKVRIPFYEYLRLLINRNIKPSPDNRSWRTLNKKLGAVGYTLPGPDVEGNLGKLVITGDTSGSMNQEDLQLVGGVIENGKNHFDSIVVIQHDDGIQKIIDTEVDYFTDEDLMFKFKGRGGTSHTPVFDLIDEKYVEDVSMIIIVSDFYSDISKKMLEKYEFVKRKIPMIAISTPSYSTNQVQAFIEVGGHHLQTGDIVVN